ncbi:hypothetical protein DEO72_LG8g818 [Vigna unguiculata]|uniref:WPP domain-containing protein n=1 Tax=Vigna unguiculata TaxID=3917 RepID=A0A4D6MN67_VIGUN|nr:hypothetical protein DEO72_LG8g818 [Vigna unguiculata]
MSDIETTPDQPSAPPQTEAPPQPNPYILSKCYDTLSSNEASTAAHQIEGEAFSAAGASAATSVDGIETLQLYSKEIGLLFCAW